MRSRDANGLHPYRSYVCSWDVCRNSRLWPRCSFEGVRSSPIDARLCNPGRSATTPKERGLPSCPCRACACERGRPSAHWECEEGRQPEGRGRKMTRHPVRPSGQRARTTAPDHWYPTRPTTAGFRGEMSYEQLANVPERQPAGNLEFRTAGATPRSLDQVLLKIKTLVSRP